MLKRVVFATVMIALTSSSVLAESIWIRSDVYAGLHLVVSDAASESEKFAAEEFQKYWKETTGHAIGISNRGESGKVNVWIGREGTDLLREGDLDGLGDDGYLLRTIQSEDKALLIVGGQKRGTLYGVDEFFKKYMGIRWLTPAFTHIPEAPSSLPTIDYRFVSPFRYRDISYRPFMSNPEHAMHHKVIGHAMPAIPDRMGGHIKFLGVGAGHTTFSFVSPEEYGKTHPEYFSEILGERVTKRDFTQLCLSNPDVLQITIDRVRDLLRHANPGFNIVSVAQMDFWSWCTCKECKAIDDRAGSPSGSTITFANKIAEAIEEEFPEAYIHTFAYLYSRKPPKHLKVRDNVLVQLCSIECDFSHPLSDRTIPVNRAFQKDIKEWAKICKNLFIYDYTQNWFCHQQPQPNYHVIQPNLKFFAENGAVGVYEQSNPLSPHADFEYLKSYLVAESLWDPDVDWHALYDEFLELYYGDAAPFIREYHQLITDKVHRDNYVLGIFSEMEWMDYDTVAKAQELFTEAFNAANGDPVLTERLKDVYVSIQYAALVCPPRVRQTPDAYILTRPPSQTFDEYWDMLMEYGVTHVADDLISELAERMHRKTPPRYARFDIEKLENENYEIWILPSMNGSVMRFRDKRTDQELLTGQKGIQRNFGMLQDWSIVDPVIEPETEEELAEEEEDAEKKREKYASEMSVAEEYEIVDRTDSSLTIQATTDDGLVVTRNMSLEPGSDEFEVTLAIENAGDQSVLPRLKVHPEFQTFNQSKPEIWIERDGAWGKVEMEMLPNAGDNIAGGSIQSDGVTAWAYRIPRKRLSLINKVKPDELDSLFYFYNRRNQHLNLELIPKQTPLAPGERRTLHSTYAITRKRSGES